MPQHFLRPRRSASNASIATPTRPKLKTSPQSVPRSVPTSNEDEETDQSPSFTELYVRCAVVDENGRAVPLAFDCSISRGFFKVKDDWICYRRNYINVSASLRPRTQEFVYIPSSNSQLNLVRRFAFVVAAVTATDPPRPIEMIQHTPKRDKGPQRSPEFVQITHPTYKAEWSRLQYKVATANNGKKRGQQYFSLKVTVLGWIEPVGRPGSWIELGDKYSEPMIVRGRSPGHYNDTDSSYSDGDGSPPTSPLLEPGTVSDALETSTSERGFNSQGTSNFNHGQDHRWMRVRPTVVSGTLPAAQPPRLHPYQDNRVLQDESTLKHGDDPLGGDDRHGSGSDGRFSEVVDHSRRRGHTVPLVDASHESPTWDPDHHVQLAPIRGMSTCIGSRPRLPTYDEIVSDRREVQNAHDGVGSSDPPMSPDLQAALSLASISGSSSLPGRHLGTNDERHGTTAALDGTMKRTAIEALLSPKSKSPCTDVPQKGDTIRTRLESLQKQA